MTNLRIRTRVTESWSRQKWEMLTENEKVKSRAAENVTRSSVNESKSLSS